MDDVSQLAAALSGRYEIEMEIGRGGMATVYLARDAKHNRRVALKLLSPELRAVLGAERFLSEIRVTANLQHPNLLPLFDSGEAAGLLFYVMPFVEGESLRHRIEREKQLPVDDAVRISVAVASALDYAHRHGVIHRDLKPENILLHDGQPLIADFGIALAVSNAGGTRVTQTGVSLGTPQYMSPEQATGDRAIDGRTDIYSLGAVAYEMLAGEPPHTGATAQAIIAKLLTEEPRPLAVLRRTVPDAVNTAVQRALEKLPADRWTSAAQFAEALQGKAVAVRRQPSAQPFWSARHWTSMLSLGASFAIAAVGIAAWFAARSVVPAPAMRFELTVPPRALILGMAVAQSVIVPDGTALIVRGQGTKSAILYRRPSDQALFIPIAGSEGATGFAVSPDGNWIAFAADSQLKKVPIQGGAPTTIVNLVGPPPGGLSWGHDVIVLGASAGSPALTAVPVSGGNRRPISLPDTARGRNHRWPRVLADGETVLFAEFPREGLDSARIGITSLATGATTVLDLLGVHPLGVMDGHIVYVRADGTIMAVPIDLKHRRISGEPIAMEQGVNVHRNSGGAQADLSPSGMLAFATGDDARRLVLVDRVTGTERFLTDKQQAYSAPRYSPNGRRLAFITGQFPRNELWVYDIAAQTQIRLAEGIAFWNLHPAWTPDGKRIAFSSSRGRPIAALWWQVADGSGAAEPLASSAEEMNEVAFSPDGNTIVFRQGGPPHRLVYRTLQGDTTITSLVASPYITYHPSISPDGKWLAYTSYETGEPRVYVRAFPGPASKWPVSDGLAVEPRWSPDGRSLYYRSIRKMIAAHIATSPTFAVTSRDTVFADRFLRGVNHRSYDLSPDGKTFVMIATVAGDSSLTVIANWRMILRARSRVK